MLPFIGAVSGGIIAFLVVGLVGVNAMELVLPALGAAFGHFMNTI